MKSHEQKNRDKTRVKKKGKQRAIKTKLKKRRKGNKMLSQKNEKGWKKTLTKDNKREGTEDQGLIYVHP
jgi:hypothetical protein